MPHSDNKCPSGCEFNLCCNATWEAHAMYTLPQKSFRHYGKQHPQKTRYRTTIWFSNPTSGIYPKEMMESGSWWDVCTFKFFAAVFTVTKLWKQLKCLLMNKCMKKIYVKCIQWNVQFRSVAQSCPTLCDPMNRSTPGLPVHHQLLELTQTHVHPVGNAIQPSHPLSSPSPPAPNPSQHQSLFQWVNSSHEVAKVLEFQL